MEKILSTAETVRFGVIDPTADAIATVKSGTTLQYLNTWTHWGNQARYGLTFEEREPLRHQFPKGPYSMIGPVAIQGARPGDVLEVKIKTLRLIDWGWNSFPLGVGALPDRFTKPFLHYFKFDESRQQTEFVKGVHYDLQPFIGILAVEPDLPTEISGMLAGNYGGNLDLNYLGEGATVFLPVQKEGARLWLGNIKAKQADGSVDQTGIESAAEKIELEVTTRTSPVTQPIVETAEHWIVFGFSDVNLDEALTKALEQAIEFLSTATELTAAEIYSLASVSIDFHVTQYAHQLHSAYQAKPPKTIHALIPKKIFSPALQQKIAATLRGERDGR